MSTMKRSKAELLGLVERIVTMFNDEHKTCEEIETALRDEGFDISRESIRRTVKKNRQIARELEKARAETEALIDTIRERPSTDISEATADFLIAKVFEYTKSIEAIDFADVPELSRFIKDISKVKMDIVKQRMDYQKVYIRAKDDILKQIQEALGEDEDLFGKLKNLIMSLEAPTE